MSQDEMTQNWRFRAMFKPLIVIAAALLMMNTAKAAVQIVIPPAGWQQKTDSTTDIKSYLADRNSGHEGVKSVYPADLTHAIEKYKDEVQHETLSMFTAKEINDYAGSICKISITTGKTADTDPSPPEVLALDFLADNTAPACIKLAKKLTDTVNKNRNLSYPQKVKSAGVLSIDMIFIFDKSK